MFHVLRGVGAPTARAITLAVLAARMASPVSASQARQPFSGRVMDEKTTTKPKGTRTNAAVRAMRAFLEESATAPVA